MTHNTHFAKNLYNSYENYKEQRLVNRRFKHSNIIPLIDQLKNKKIFKVNKIGESIEKRDVFLITIGTGKNKIFCWSQMHGDESTATAAIFDIINFFIAENHFVEFKKILLSSVTLHFLPMLNPDGAESFQRRNDIEIDLNRDALLMRSPESVILNSVFNQIKPDFAFNLHDQERVYSAGLSGKSSAIAFLAPAFDYEKTINESRTNAMKLIGELYRILSEIIPGHISKYKDDYEPRAFGDNFSKLGSSVILVESGGWKEDREKMFIRKLNFVALLTSFKCIAEESYGNEITDTYFSIPENEKMMMDLIIRNIKIKKGEGEYIIDVGINYEEINFNDNRNFYCIAKIEDIGDLSVFSGYKELDATGTYLEPGKTYEQIFNSVEEINNLDINALLEDGITNIKIKSTKIEYKFSPILFNLVVGECNRIELLKKEYIPNFVLRENGKIKYSIINGFPIEINKKGRQEGNALIFK